MGDFRVCFVSSVSGRTAWQEATRCRGVARWFGVGSWFALVSVDTFSVQGS